MARTEHGNAETAGQHSRHGAERNDAPGGTHRASGRAAVTAVFEVVDDQQRRYRLSHDSSGASASGEKPQRWDLRARIDPAPGHDVNWLEFLTEQGPIRVPLRPPVPTAVTIEALDPAPSELEHHLNAQIHNQVWLHLLDRDRPLKPLGILPEALVAVGAIDPDHPVV